MWKYKAFQKKEYEKALDEYIKEEFGEIYLWKMKKKIN